MGVESELTLVVRRVRELDGGASDWTIGMECRDDEQVPVLTVPADTHNRLALLLATLANPAPPDSERDGGDDVNR